MQAIILAAGKGSRLLPLTKDKPKCFLELQNVKLIDYQIRLLQKFGISEIIIITGNKSDMIEEHVVQYKNVNTIFNPFYNYGNVLSSFWVGMDKLSDDFIYLHADTIFDVTILEKLMNAPGEIVLPIDKKICGFEEMKVKVNHHNEITEINKTMNSEDAVGEFIGIAKFEKSTLEKLKEVVLYTLKNNVETAFFEEALQQLVNDNVTKINLLDITGEFWNEIDFFEDYEAAKKEIHESKLIHLFSNSETECNN